MRLIHEVKRVVLEEPVDPWLVWFLEKLKCKFHEEAVVLEKQVFNTKLFHSLAMERYRWNFIISLCLPT